MTISSRTPEGESNTCPVCGHAVKVEPSIIFEDAPCPHCGHLLWFIRLGQTARVIAPGVAGKRRRLSAVLAERLNITENQLLEDPALIDQLGLDSIDAVELVMELEDEARR